MLTIIEKRNLMTNKRFLGWVVILFFFIAFLVEIARANPVTYDYTRENNKFIINYQDYLNKKFIKIERKKTLYIIIHTSEAGLISTLNTLSNGKNVGKYRTIGGHSHYVIARDGQVYRILNHRYRADHAGLSMWNSMEDISSYSVSIEMVGYHYDSLTPEQYKSLGVIIKVLQRIYKIPDRNILTHSQVSYGKPNLWHKRPSRGRKRCAINFDREQIGLVDSWTFDPDVKAGRLAQDTYIYNVFYKKYYNLAKQISDKVTDITTDNTQIVQGKEQTEGMESNGVPIEEKISNIISKENTAWNIAGEDYDDSTTFYVLPDNRIFNGEEIGKSIGWAKIPAGTKVLLNQPLDLEEKKGPLLLISKDYTAWSYAGKNYSDANTYYFLPDGNIIPGDKMKDWDNIPDGSYMIIGYKEPYIIRPVKGQTPWGLAGRNHKKKDTVYFIPGQGVMTGDKVKDFSNLPPGSLLFLRCKNKKK